MRYLLSPLLLWAGLYFYFSKATPGESVSVPRAPAQQTEPEAERVVQIQGKMYKYRPDNRYVIDGVPTYFVPNKTRTVLKDEHKEPENPKPEQSQKLLRLAAENPTALYSPEGMKLLKESLEAAQKGAVDRKQALDELGGN